MPSTITAEKAALRSALRARLKALPPALRREEDRQLLDRFLALPQVAAARALLLYDGMGSEPGTAALFAPLWAAGKRIYLPRCLPGNQMEARLVQKETELILHPWGMREPDPRCPLADPAELDLALVPGLAFDRSGGRLGQGGGYYDRWLRTFQGFTVALCRKAALVDRVPREAHDLLVDLVVCPGGLYGPSAPSPEKSGAKTPRFSPD